MTARSALTGALLLFVAASVGILATREFRGNPATTGGPSAPAVHHPDPVRKVVAYYFTGKVRCAACRRIEELSRKTIEENFSAELLDGRLQFLVQNMDKPENRHFIEEYRLSASALVLVETKDGKPVAWKNLQEVWTYVGDESRFITYVREEVSARLRGV